MNQQTDYLSQLAAAMVPCRCLAPLVDFCGSCFDRYYQAKERVSGVAALQAFHSGKCLRCAGLGYTLVSPAEALGVLLKWAHGAGFWWSMHQGQGQPSLVYAEVRGADIFKAEGATVEQAFAAALCQALGLVKEE